MELSVKSLVGGRLCWWREADPGLGGGGWVGAEEEGARGWMVRLEKTKTFIVKSHGFGVKMSGLSHIRTKKPVHVYLTPFLN